MQRPKHGGFESRDFCEYIIVILSHLMETLANILEIVFGYTTVIFSIFLQIRFKRLIVSAICLNSIGKGTSKLTFFKAVIDRSPSYHVILIAGMEIFLDISTGERVRENCTKSTVL